MNKGRLFALGDEGEYHEIGEIKEVDTFCPAALDEQLEEYKEAWRCFREQITLVIETPRNLTDVLNGIVPKYMRTELKFPKKKKRGTMRRQRRERRANE
jgi:hypothetical protein